MAPRNREHQHDPLMEVNNSKLLSAVETTHSVNLIYSDVLVLDTFGFYTCIPDEQAITNQLNK